MDDRCCYFLSMDGGETATQCVYGATMTVYANGKPIRMCDLHGTAYERAMVKPIGMS